MRKPRPHSPGARKRERQGRIYRRTFISLDGEATTKDGKYGLLASSAGDYIANRRGLTTEECLDFLLALPKHHTKGGGKPIYVGFAIDYDVNMILCDLPLFGETASIEELRRDGVTHWRGYTIRYFHRKIFRVSRGKKTLTWFDTWGYFQSSFEKALIAWKIPVPEIITEGKKARGSFHRWSMEKLRAYNDAELSQHVELMNQLRAAIAPLNLTVYSWHGPAALAGYWLTKHDVASLQAELSPNLEDVACRAYFGGRIDVRGYGKVEPVYHYDIVSAYPAATRFLPDLSKTTWKKTRLPESPLYCARIRWQVPEGTHWPPFPWRNHRGTIRYPLAGEGWYWVHELEAAREVFGDCFEILECYSGFEDESEPLKELIEETFSYRAELKAAGNPSHVPVKLILNSIYGKFAQQVGAAKHRNIIWAGLITSYTRAQMMRAITPATVCVMTDSVWSAEPLNVETSGQLGGWEQEPETRLVVAEAGLYQAWRPDGTEQTWQRGFDRNMPVDIEHLVNEWLDGDECYAPVYNVHRFVGMGLATITNYQWREWRDIERTIHPVPLVGTTKREPHLPNDSGTRVHDFMSLPVRPTDTEECSSPYIRETKDLELEAYRLQDEVIDDPSTDY